MFNLGGSTLPFLKKLKELNEPLSLVQRNEKDATVL